MPCQINKFTTCMADDIDIPIQRCLDQLDAIYEERPDTYELIITELHHILNKYDPDIRDKKVPSYRLVKDDFDADEMLKKIRTTANWPNLKIPEIRFKADELSRRKQIPLPKSTRKHKEPLLQWFKIHWEELESDVRGWCRK